MQQNYKVYMHVFPNGKKYIGITVNEKKRWNYGRGYYDQRLMRQAINKYGWKNIEHKILFTNLSKEEACAKEIELIKAYNTTDIKNGYNISAGGEGTTGVKRNSEQRKKQSELLTKIKGRKIVRLIYDDMFEEIGIQFYNSISMASKMTKLSKSTITKHLNDKEDKEWRTYEEYYIDEMLEDNIDETLYRYLLKQEYCTDLFVELMGADINFWNKLVKYDKRYKKSSESPVKKVVL